MFTREYRVLFSDRLERTGAQMITFQEKGTNNTPFDIVFGYDKSKPILFETGTTVKITFEPTQN